MLNAMCVFLNTKKGCVIIGIQQSDKYHFFILHQWVCDLLESHSKGKDTFSWFLAALYTAVGTITMENLADSKST